MLCFVVLGLEEDEALTVVKAIADREASLHKALEAKQGWGLPTEQAASFRLLTPYVREALPFLVSSLVYQYTVRGGPCMHAAS